MIVTSQSCTTEYTLKRALQAIGFSYTPVGYSKSYYNSAQKQEWQSPQTLSYLPPDYVYFLRIQGIDLYGEQARFKEGPFATWHKAEVARIYGKPVIRMTNGGVGGSKTKQ